MIIPEKIKQNLIVKLYFHAKIALGVCRQEPSFLIKNTEDCFTEIGFNVNVKRVE